MRLWWSIKNFFRLVVSLYHSVLSLSLSLPPSPFPLIGNSIDYFSRFCFYGHKITLICCLFSLLLLYGFLFSDCWVKTLIFINTFPVFHWDCIFQISDPSLYSVARNPSLCPIIFTLFSLAITFASHLEVWPKFLSFSLYLIFVFEFRINVCNNEK